ncbi:hypothetical protein ABG067_007804, partial [Albugo candida]
QANTDADEAADLLDEMYEYEQLGGVGEADAVDEVLESDGEEESDVESEGEQITVKKVQQPKKRRLIIEEDIDDEEDSEEEARPVKQVKKKNSAKSKNKKKPATKKLRNKK